MPRRKNASRCSTANTISFAIRARDARACILRSRGVPLSSFHRRIASRFRFREYLSRYRATSKGLPEAQVGPRPVKHRSLARFYRELVQDPRGPSIGARAGVRGAIAGDDLETDTASRHQGDDRLRRDGPAGAPSRHVLASLRGPGIAQASSGRRWSSWSCWSRSSASSSG